MSSAVLPSLVGRCITRLLQVDHALHLSLLAVFSNNIVEELKNMLIGQSLDLRWVHDVSTPSVEEYLQMVDGSKWQLAAPRADIIRLT